MTKPITMIEIFSGIGAQAKALSRLPIPHEVIATMDVDKDAILSYASMRYDLEREIQTYCFPSKEEMVSELQRKNVGFDFQKSKYTITMKTNIDKVKQYYIADKLSKNLGDVSLQKELPYADIICHTSPCQDYSCAGLGAGGDEGSGTRSSLMFESLRLIGTSKPRFIIWENVANVLSGKHRHNFISYLEKLTDMGYKNTFNLLNAKNYGVAQNRLRIFCVSKRIDNNIKDDDVEQFVYRSKNKQAQETMKEVLSNSKIKVWKDFQFPEQIPLTLRLKDMLEQNVDEKYYLPDERIEKILNSTFIQEKKRIQTTDVCDTLLARDWKDPKCVPVEELEPNTCLIQPKDRDYKKKNQTREVHIESKNDGVSYALRTNGETMVIEPFIAASRGRNPENPSDRTVGAPTEQRLEPNFSGCTNTLTSVQKDNYVCEPIIYDDYNSRISADQDAINTLTCNCGASAERNGVKIIEPVIIEDFYQSREPRVYEQVAPTLRSERTGLKVADCEYPCSTRGKQVASAIRASIYKQGARNLEQNVVNGLGYEGVIESGEPRIRWRIRKLTPKETTRLMNFTDKDYEAMAKYVSSSTIYKADGNSIVVACLIAIMSSLFIKDGYKAEIWTKYKINYKD